MWSKPFRVGPVLAGILAAIGLIWLLTLPGATASAAPSAIGVGTRFTLQAYMDDNGSPANGSYDFQFALFDAAAGGSQVGGTLAVNDLAVFDGYFDVALDFGASAFGGGARYLETRVRPGASAGPYSVLSPRRELTPAPYALALPNVYANEALNFVGIGRNFRISGNEAFGVRYTGGANQYGGMYMETSNANGWPFYGYATNGAFRAWTYYDGTTGDWHLYNAGIRLSVPNEGGLRIGPSADYSLVISNTTGSDGLRIYDTGDDAIQLGSDPDYANYGVYIPSPGVSTYGLWPNTSNASGNYALYTVDNIEAGTVTAAALTLVAKVGEGAALEVGDVVSVLGLAPALPDGATRLAQVSVAVGPNPAGLAGVVASRMVWQVAPGKEDEGAMALQPAEGAAQPGEYVSIVVLGIAQVKVDPAADIVAGQRLTVSDLAGQARALVTRTIDGMLVAEGAPVIGVALEAPVDGRDTIAVFVSLR
jgi:hypothetical protein